MATNHAACRVHCRACGWRGQRVPHDPMDPNTEAEVSGFGPCPGCGGALKRSAFKAEARAARAKAELAALEQGGRA